MPPCDGDPCTALFNSSRCSSFSAGGNLPTAQKPAPPDRAPRTPWPIGQWYGHPVPAHGLLPPSNLAPAAIARATFPAPGASAPGTFGRRTSASSMPHRSSSAPISSMPTATPTRTSRSFPALLNRSYPTPNPWRFHPGFGLVVVNHQLLLSCHPAPTAWANTGQRFSNHRTQRQRTRTATV